MPRVGGGGRRVSRLGSVCPRSPVLSPAKPPPPPFSAPVSPSPRSLPHTPSVRAPARPPALPLPGRVRALSPAVTSRRRPRASGGRPHLSCPLLLSPLFPSSLFPSFSRRRGEGVGGGGAGPGRGQVRRVPPRRERAWGEGRRPGHAAAVGAAGGGLPAGGCSAAAGAAAGALAAARGRRRALAATKGLGRRGRRNKDPAGGGWCGPAPRWGGRTGASPLPYPTLPAETRPARGQGSGCRARPLPLWRPARTSPLCLSPSRQSENNARVLLCLIMFMEAFRSTA